MFDENAFSLLAPETEQDTEEELTEDDAHDKRTPIPVTPETRGTRKQPREKGKHDERALHAAALAEALQESKGRITQSVGAVLRDINADIVAFLNDGTREQMTLPPMTSFYRSIFQLLCSREYQLTAKTRGERKQRCLVVYVNQRSKIHGPWTQEDAEAALERVMKDEFQVDLLQLDRDAAMQPKPGKVVGEGAEPLDASNVGYRMWKAMGGMGDENGENQGKERRQAPEVRVKVDRRGL